MEKGRDVRMGARGWVSYGEGDIWIFSDVEEGEADIE